MDLLETVLRASDAEKYIENFKKCKLDAGTLPLLKEQDLQLLGVDQETQKKILKNVGNLQIPCEKNINLMVNMEYAQIVLHQIGRHLQYHYANLCCALTRSDIVICDVNLIPATNALVDCVNMFEEELNKFEEKLPHVEKRRKSDSRKLKIKLAIIGLTLIPVVLFIRKKTIFGLKS